VNDFPVAALIGLFAGFLGAIPPGPLNVTLLRKSLQGRRREAFRVALGGAAVDALICGFIGLGFGWLLEKVVTNRWVKGPLALFLVAYGLKILWDAWHDGRQEPWRENSGSSTPLPEPPASSQFRLHVLVGLLQGAANPALFVNWTLLLTFLWGHQLLGTGAAPATGFSLGVGVGVFAWFTVLIEVLERLKGLGVGGWVQRFTVMAGALLVLFGLFFSYRSFAGG